jgi:hypothetical protein
MKRIVFAAAALAATLSAAPAAAQGRCDRASMQAIADSWVDALNGGTPYGKMQLGEWVNFHKNMADGFMSEFFDMNPKKVDWHLSVLDTTACKATVESVIEDKGGPRVLVTQLSMGFNGVGPIDIMFPAAEPAGARAAFTAPAWAPVPEGQRMTREALVAAADAWLADKQPDKPQDRIYVVDEALGAVNVYSHLAGKANSVTLRIEGGQVKAVHQLTA